jgi:hypothetical protein
MQNASQPFHERPDPEGVDGDDDPDPDRTQAAPWG